MFKNLYSQKEARDTLLSIILIIILGFAVYGNSVEGQFVWDDVYLIKNNVYIKNCSNLAKIFTQNIGAGAGQKYSFYRPLQLISYMIDYSVWRLNVKGYHLTNIFLHIFVSLAIFYLCLLVYAKLPLALLTSILFLVHPVHTEVVSYISGRADSLAVLFIMVCFIFYIKNLRNDNPVHIFTAVLTYIFALLSKEISLILPSLLFLYHFVFRKKIKFLPLFYILIITLIYILARLTILKSILANIKPPSATFLERIPGFFVAIFNYVRILFIPINLHMEYGKEVFSLLESKAMLGVAISFTVLIYAFKKLRNNHLAFFSILWFFIALLPQSNLLPLNAYMAEHWLYLPSIGFFFILAYGFIHLYPRLKLFSLVVLISLVTFYSYLTVKQNTYWRESLSFYERTLKYAPLSARLNNNLGLTYQAINENQKAISLFKKAIELKPKYHEAYHNLGFTYMSMNRFDEAIELFKKAIKIEPEFTDAYSNLGSAYYFIDETEEAAHFYKKAIELNPYYAPAYNNLGIIYAAKDKTDEAVELFKKAISIDPDYQDAYNNLANIYNSTNKIKEAITLYKESIKIDPKNSITYYNLGLAYQAINKNKEAFSSYSRAIELNPDYAKAYNNIGVLCLRDKKFKEAKEFFEKALEADPKYSPAYDNLSLVQERLESFKEEK